MIPLLLLAFPAWQDPPPPEAIPTDPVEWGDPPAPVGGDALPTECGACGQDNIKCEFI